MAELELSNRIRMRMRAAFKLKTALFLLPILGASWVVRAGEHEHPAPERLGTVEFPVSCSGDVQKRFERGVALLHSFAYSAAEKVFNEVIKADPNCAMAHWGIAMTYFHPLWPPPLPEETVARGREEIERARQLGGSDREREFIEALSFIYANDSVPYRDRVNRYTGAMDKLAERNRDDSECQIFYALALIAVAPPTDATHAKQKEAVAILEPLFKKYPQHPGIPHYLIHAYDNVEMASRGVEASRVYAQIAPSAPHALHMPSHIYTRLGMWEESIASNTAARKAAQIPNALLQAAAITAWSREVGFARSKQAELARAETARIKSTYEQMRAAGDEYWATQIHVQLNSALAWINYAEGQNDEALKLMRAAADEEDAVEKQPVTPGAIVPAREQLGDLLLETGNTKEAQKEFQKALSMTPKRHGALLGAERAGRS